MLGGVGRCWEVLGGQGGGLFDVVKFLSTFHTVPWTVGRRLCQVSLVGHHPGGSAKVWLGELHTSSIEGL